jgi:hypothetical protein
MSKYIEVYDMETMEDLYFDLETYEEFTERKSKNEEEEDLDVY